MTFRGIVELLVAALVTTQLTYGATGDKCHKMIYEDRNQVDPPELKVSKVRGAVLDRDGVPIPGACLGLFTDPGLRLVAQTSSDGDGRFDFREIRPGKYRIVARYSGFCPPNAQLMVTEPPRAGRHGQDLVVHMIAPAIDVCSYVTYK